MDAAGAEAAEGKSREAPPLVRDVPEFVSTPEIDPEGVHYREASKRVVEAAAPKDKSALAQYFQQQESVKNQLLHSAKASQRMSASS